jgi:DNA-binding MarR family transcriptional regulator
MPCIYLAIVDKANTMEPMNQKAGDKSPNLNIQIGEMDSYLGYWLRFVSNQVTNAFQQKLAKKDITVAEWLVLRFLWSHAPCSSTRLSEELVIDKGGISRLSDRLEKRNLIKRTVDQKDRRLYSIELTPLGIKLVPELAQIADENDAYFFGHLTGKKFDGIMKLLKDMVNRHEFSQKPVD